VLAPYPNAYPNQTDSAGVHGRLLAHENRCDLQKLDTGEHRRTRCVSLGVKWSQVQILSAQTLSAQTLCCLGTSLTDVPRHHLHLGPVFGGVSAFDAAGLVVAAGV
jgi:hypothetical protein